MSKGERVLRRVAIVLLALGMLSVIPAEPTAAAASPLPENAMIYFPGHGWGHGRGMGQWGAQGMAARGVEYADILHHYYAGVSLTARPAENVRVLLEASSDTLVTSSAVFSAVWKGGSAIGKSTDSQPFLRATQSSGTYKLQRGASRTGPWTTVATGSVPIVFKPGAGMLQLVAGDGTIHYYRGYIEARAYLTSSTRSINDLPLESYLKGVVPREMPSSWRLEALKAQSVAARSYTLNKKVRARANGDSYDICATTACQVYGGYGYKPSASSSLQVSEASGSNAAIAATAGKVMTVSGTPILAEYSSSTGGYTAPGSVSYLKAVPDPDDAISPHHDWTGEVRAYEIEDRWPAIGRLVNLKVTSRNGYGEWGGRVLQMDIVGTVSTVHVSGGTFASAFQWPGRSNGLQGSWFKIQIWNGALAGVSSKQFIAPGEDLPVRVRLTNVGTTSWAIGGPVRLVASSSEFSGPEWISGTRAAAVSKNVTDPDATAVKPGQVAEFSFILHTSSLAAGSYSQRFSTVAESTSWMNPTFWVGFTVVPPAAPPGIVSGNTWSLNYGYDSRADVSFKYGRSTDKKLAGDWDGDGTFTPGLVRGNTWYLSNGLGASAAHVFEFGRATDVPVVGDWDGDGTFTWGVVRDNTWYLSNGPGKSSIRLAFGRDGDRPVVGDWDGNGTYTPGLVRGNIWYLDNGFDGRSEHVFSYGRSTDTPVVGDWDGSGTVTPGVVRGSTWYLSEGFDSTVSIHFDFGNGDGTKLAGNWARSS